MVLQVFETERAIESLEQFSIEDIGNDKWMRQHMLIQKLNLQAHECVQKNEENYVLEALVTHDKMATILRELILVEAWREKVLTMERIVQHLGDNCSIRGYHAAYQEAAICNLLEVVLYHDYAAEACGDLIIELVDYCVRRVRWLCSRSIRELEGEEEDGTEDSGDNSENVREFKRQLRDLEWRSSIAAVSILRYLTEHVKQLPLGVMTRMIDTHDVPCLIVPLIENPPWTRRTDKGQWEKLKDLKWTPVQPQDLLVLTPLEAQPWLILFNLLCEGEFRQRYHFHSFRKDSILRVRKYLNVTLVDQLPVLADLQRTLDELVILDAPPATTSSSALIMEQVAQIRDHVLSKTNWNAEIERAINQNFKKETKTDPIVLELANMYGNEDIEQLLDGSLLQKMQAELNGEEEPDNENDGKHANPIVDDSTAPPDAPKKEQQVPPTIYPEKVVLALQTGKMLSLTPVSKFGTVQETSKGKFIRFQLVPQDDAGQEELNATIPTEQILKMTITDSRGNTTDVFSKAIKPGQPEFWQKLGSIKQGTLAQVQCKYEPESKHITLRACFVSLKN